MFVHLDYKLIGMVCALCLSSKSILFLFIRTIKDYQLIGTVCAVWVIILLLYYSIVNSSRLSKIISYSEWYDRAVCVSILKYFIVYSSRLSKIYS